MSRVVQAFLLSGVFVLAASAPASAALIFTFEEVGGNVELTMSGSINLDATISGLGPGGGGGFLILEPGDGVIRVGSGPNYFREISNILSPEWTPFGSGVESFSGMTAGDRVELAGDGNLGYLRYTCQALRCRRPVRSWAQPSHRWA